MHDGGAETSESGTLPSTSTTGGVIAASESSAVIEAVPELGPALPDVCELPLVGVLDPDDSDDVPEDEEPDEADELPEPLA